MSDAERALSPAIVRSETVFFERDWVLATLFAQMPRRRPLTVAPDTARSPHLADAVLAFVDNRFSISGAAEALRIHPNTVKYRLSRWQQLTGWDVHTFDGMLRSLLSIVV